MYINTKKELEAEKTNYGNIADIKYKSGNEHCPTKVAVTRSDTCQCVKTH
jgi:hypothetical protein